MSRSASFALAFACCFVSARVGWSEEVIRRIDWQELAAGGALASGIVVTVPEGIAGPSVRVVHQGPTSATFPLVTIDRPAITAPRYAIRGRARYEGVAAGSYLELWNHLPDGAFFSRTLDPSGPMGRFEGSSPWRGFVLPFFNKEGGAAPTRLVLNLVLRGAGTVEIGPLELVQFAPGDDPFAESTAWWSSQQGGVLGAIAGSALGLVGALVGWFASTGRAGGFVFVTLRVLAWAGVGAALLGVVALASDQPYAVYYPLLLVGTLAAVFGFLLPRSLRVRYGQQAPTGGAV
jgi:hypothetical protein